MNLVLKKRLPRDELTVVRSVKFSIAEGLFRAKLITLRKRYIPRIGADNSYRAKKAGPVAHFTRGKGFVHLELRDISPRAAPPQQLCSHDE
jgi:hypothetical protein